MELFLVAIVVVVAAGAGFYYYTEIKRKEYIQDYEIDLLEQELEQKRAKDQLDAHVREEQKKKPFYLDVILTHDGAIGVRAALDNEGKRRKGILPIRDIPLVRKNIQGEDQFFHIDEAGLELWATFERDELLLKSKEKALEIRRDGMAKDAGTSTFKATIQEGVWYNIILDSRYEIRLLAKAN